MRLYYYIPSSPCLRSNLLAPSTNSMGGRPYRAAISYNNRVRVQQLYICRALHIFGWSIFHLLIKPRFSQGLDVHCFANSDNAYFFKGGWDCI